MKIEFIRIGSRYENVIEKFSDFIQKKTDALYATSLSVKELSCSLNAACTIYKEYPLHTVFKESIVTDLIQKNYSPSYLTDEGMEQCKLTVEEFITAFITVKEAILLTEVLISVVEDFPLNKDTIDSISVALH